MKLVYDAEQIEFEVWKSKKRKNSFEISVKADGRIIVRVPEGSSEEAILMAVRGRADWILEKQQEFRQKREDASMLLQNKEGRLLYRGEYRELVIRKNYAFVRPKIMEMEGKIIIYTAAEEKQAVEKALHDWYQSQAEKILKDRVEYYSRFIAEQAGTVRIKEQKSRWGSCSAKGNVNLNWRLLLAPQEVLDYVVVHELAHLKFMNHSRDFWNHVAEILPDYKQWDSWLKQNGAYLMQYQICSVKKE